MVTFVPKWVSINALRQCDIYINMYSTLMAIFEMNYICKICCLQMCLHMLTVSRLWVCDVVRFGLGNRNSNGKHNFATTHKEPFPLLPRIRIYIYICTMRDAFPCRISHYWHTSGRYMYIWFGRPGTPGIRPLISAESIFIQCVCLLAINMESRTQMCDN